ncbi:MAG: tetratricopeptide repeat protein [Polyangiaceae bacterium]
MRLGNILKSGLSDATLDKPKSQASYEKAMALDEAGCDAGKLLLCEELASHYESGLGAVAANPNKAAIAFAKLGQRAQLACDAGDTLGCFEVGYLYYNGKGGLAKDPTKAVVFFERACSANSAAGCFYRGLAYEFGFGYEKDPVRAIEQFESACVLGHGRGCYRAAWLLRKDGPAKDEKLAIVALSDGCVRRFADACNDLGVTYGSGEHGGTKDPDLALASYRRGCNLGGGLPCDNFSKFSKRVETEKAGAEFRKNLKVGDDSHCGLVIEVKPPIAKVQTMIGEVWLKVEQLYAPGKADCRFRNGVYQDPD